MAWKDKRDLELHQVRVEPDGSTVASDGNVMLAVSPVKGYPRGLPEMPDEKKVEDGVGIPIEIVTEALKNIPKGSLGFELGYAVVTKCEGEGAAGTIELTTTDLNKRLKVEGPIARKLFPEWKGVMRKAKDRKARRIAVNRKSLIVLLEAMDVACPDPNGVVFMELSENEEVGILFRAEAADTKQRAVGYIMPLDTQGEWLKMSKWEKRLFGKSAKIGSVAMVETKRRK